MLLPWLLFWSPKAALSQAMEQGDENRREPRGGDVEVLMPRGAPEAASPEARPGAMAGEELRPAPEVGAPEAPVVPHEAAPGGIPQAGPLGADHLYASSRTQTDTCAALRPVSRRLRGPPQEEGGLGR